MKKYLILFSVVIFLTGLFGYKLLEVPTGLTLDEAAFGYNAGLLAKTGRDENHRLLPMFVLSSNGTDWRQPVTQYYLTVLFKIFGPSVFLLRFSSVLIVVGCTIGLFFLGKKLLGTMGGVISAVCFAITPLVFIQSHMGLDNIMPIPFTIVWLWACFEYLKKKELKWILLAGLSLGISMYSYKGMRAMVPVWITLTGLIVLTNKVKNFRDYIKPLLYFVLVLAPFFLIIPWIEKHYAGAMVGGSKPTFNNIYDFFQPYLSSFDFSYLFVTGDLVLQHSTGRHGMYLLASAPWFFLGIYQAIKKSDRRFTLMLCAFFFGPLLLGLVGSVHRYSRLMMFIPIYSLMVGLGVVELWKMKGKYTKAFLSIGALLVLVNFLDFANYFWHKYPGITFSLVKTLQYHKDYEKLAVLSKQYNLKPITHDHTNRESGESGKFFQVIYFGKLLDVVSDDILPGKDQIIITPKDKIGNLKQLNTEVVSFRIFSGE